MPDHGPLTSKVRAYMEALSPNARAMLMRNLQGARLRGDEGGNDLLLAACASIEAAADPTRPSLPAAGAPEPRAPELSWAQRVEQGFFAPAMPFVVEFEPAQRQPGRIFIGSLKLIWVWLGRDLAPAEVARALAENPDDPAADAAVVARKLRRELAKRVIDTLRDLNGSTTARQKLAAQLGGDNALRDLADLAYVFQHEGGFINLLGQLPRLASNADMVDGSPVLDLIRRTIDDLKVDGHFVGAALLPRLSSPVVLATAAARLAGGDDGRAISVSRYAPLVDILISEVERRVELCRRNAGLRSTKVRLTDDMRQYHEVIKAFLLIIKLDSAPAWVKRLGAARRLMSEIIAKEIEGAPGEVRRCLRVGSLAGEFGASFDVSAFEDAELAVKLLNEARLAVDSLALNELVGRTRKQLEQTLEVMSNRLIAELRSNTTFDHRSVIEAVNAAIKLATLVFGEEYATVLRRSRDNAAPKPIGKTAS